MQFLRYFFIVFMGVVFVRVETQGASSEGAMDPGACVHRPRRAREVFSLSPSIATSFLAKRRLEKKRNLSLREEKDLDLTQDSSQTESKTPLKETTQIDAQGTPLPQARTDSKKKESQPPTISRPQAPLETREQAKSAPPVVLRESSV